MNTSLAIATISIIVTTLASYWSLYREIASLRERMARIEGRFEMMAPGKSDHA